MDEPPTLGFPGMTNSSPSELKVRDVSLLLRGEPGFLREWMLEPNLRRELWCAGWIVVGAGLYGAAIGCWRAPLQGLYTAIKFPLILLITALGNGLLNAMLAPLLGVGLTWRQSLRAVLLCFAMIAIILGSFSPLVLFLIWNVPPRTAELGSASTSFALLKVSQVLAIAFAGLVANIRLAQWLRELGGEARGARNVLFAWLAGNLLLGAQLTWIARPFFGSPHLEVQFLRPDAFDGNFFETVFYTVWHLLKI
jgi:hypothetical protein